MKTKSWLLLFFAIGLVSWLCYRFVIVDFLYPYDKNFKDFVLTNTRAIENVDPKSSNYEGYEEIAAAIGDSKVVFLGEQDHGDAPTFLAKTKIIKYLHEKMGFDVLVFESNFLGLNRALANQDDLSFSSDADYKKFIFPLWTNCGECTELFSYVDSSQLTERPIFVSGMDSRLFYSSEGKFPIAQLIENLDNATIFDDASEKENITNSLEVLIRDEYEASLSTAKIDSLYNFFDKAEKRLKPKSFLAQSLRSLRGFTLNTLDTAESYNARDIQMSDNFLWLKNEVFSDKKIIVWASSSHLFKGYRDLPYHIGRDNDSINTGTLIADRISDELYVLGFTSNRGKAGRLYNPKYELVKPVKNSFEAFVEETGAEYAFTNFKDYELQSSKKSTFWMNGIAHSPNRFAWTKMFDGIFYIEEMYPCSDVLNIDKFALD